jgi:predicted benzoate:H+ symporter BenE
MEKLTRSVGNLCVILGLVATFSIGIFSVRPAKLALALALFCGLLGFMSSCLYLALNARYNVNTRKFSPALIGLLLSSVPILFILFIKLSH